jgi:hypothetical protein
VITLIATNTHNSNPTFKKTIVTLTGHTMKTVKYKHHNLATNSEAYKLWEAWKKSNDPKDEQKLKAHLKDVDQRYKDLVTK